MSHSEIIHKKFSTFFRKGGEGYSEGMCKKESFLCGNKVIIYTFGIVVTDLELLAILSSFNTSLFLSCPPIP
jgi:hypothetical protein